jgi:uncharacterized protein YeaC (DUF1315 family)
MPTPNELLEEYTDIVLRKSDIESKKQAVIDTIITPEIKQRLEDVDAEFAPALDKMSLDLSMKESELKGAVVQEGQTVKGTTHMAVYVKGRVSWDTKMLDGLALVMPQLAEAKTIGSPSVSIRLVK